MEHKHESNNDGAMKSKTNIALIIFLIIGAFFLLTEHRAPATRRTRPRSFPGLV